MMAHLDERIDDYIDESREYARPILAYLRQLVHAACPEVTETMKWGFPHFDYKGMYASMAAFKEHCSFGFWKGSLLDDPRGLLTLSGDSGMASFGKVRKIADLPSDDVLLEFLIQAMDLNERGVNVPRPVKEKVLETMPLPPELERGLTSSPRAAATFRSLSHSGRNDYIRWINDAKTAPTREKRLLTTVEWLEEGKSANWKYQKKKLE